MGKIVGTFGQVQVWIGLASAARPNLEVKKVVLRFGIKAPRCSTVRHQTRAKNPCLSLGGTQG